MEYAPQSPQMFEFSYETITANTPSTSDYEICVVIPQSKKYLVYIACFPESGNNRLLSNTYLVMYELNRYKKICNVIYYSPVSPEWKEAVQFSNGVIMYGSLIETFYLVEDILLYKNTKCHNINFKEKMQHMILSICLAQCFSNTDNPTNTQYTFTLPFMFSTTEDMKRQRDIFLGGSMPWYPLHTFQFHSLHSVLPVLNLKEKPSFAINSKSTDAGPGTVSGSRSSSSPSPDAGPGTVSGSRSSSSPSPFACQPRRFLPQYSKPQYKKPTIFQIRAGLQYDIYHLYCYNNIGLVSFKEVEEREGEVAKKGQEEEKFLFVGFAHIPNYKTSVFMNSIFRVIRENENLDYIEESDDESDFENIEKEKYVFLDKRVNIKCVFHPLFKKWIPVEIEKYYGYCEKFAKIISASCL